MSHIKPIATEGKKTGVPEYDAILQRREVRRSLTAWARLNGFEPARHHRLLIEKLEMAAQRKIKRLAIFMPPGSAKSTYSSVLSPPWFLATNPGTAMLGVSHTLDLAEEFGRRMRNLIHQHRNALGYGLRRDSKAAGSWGTTNGSVFYAAGIGGNITGRRADFAIIDDPVKSAEDVQSDQYREKQWQWYLFDFTTRLKPDAVVILIQTRWHEDDLAGRILAYEGAQWDVVNLPMEAETDDALGRQPGELLWPEYFTPEMVANAKRNSRVWSALYQQRPSPEEGDYFRRSWLRLYHTYDDIPKNLHIYAAADWAVSTKQAADLTCFGPVGVDENDDLWVLPDIFWKQALTDESVEAFVAMLKRRKPLVTWSEKGHISQSVGPFLRKRMNEQRAYAFIEEVSPSRDKPTRARSIQGRMAMGKVHFPAFAHWWAAAEHELLSFPNGKHDDFVDFLAHLGMGLDSQSTAVRPRPEKKVEPLTFQWLKDVRRRHMYEALAAKDDS